MNYLKYFALFVCVALSYDTTLARRLLKTDNSGRIVGGTEVPIDEFPYMANLLLFNGSAYFECGGSIISRRYILTAAHCLEDILNVTIRIGSSMAMSGGRTYSSRTLMRHFMYNSRNLDYDVGAIRVSQNMDLSGDDVSTIQLVQGGQRIQPGTFLNVTGWGATAEGGASSSRLMGTMVPTISNDQCNEYLSPYQVTERQLCAGYEEGGRDACQGDSGGPAVSDGTQVGIVSGGFGCARPESPGFYTNITNQAIRRWIRLNTGV